MRATISAFLKKITSLYNHYLKNNLNSQDHCVDIYIVFKLSPGQCIWME